MAFYDDMQDVATELLTEFGKTLTFERITKTFDKITGKDTARSTAEFTTVGVEVPINQRLVDGTRIQAGDRFFIIDSSFAPAMGDRLQDSAFVACAHPLNATEAEILALGVDGKLTMSNSEQTGTYTIQSGLASSETFAAGSLSAIDYTTGVKTTEYPFSLPTITGGAGSPAIIVTASLDENPFSGNAPIRVKATSNDDGTYTASVLVDNVQAYSGACSATGRFTIIANGDTGNVVVKLNGVALTLSDSTYVMQDALLTCSVEEAAGISGAYTGQTASITTITRAASILYGSGLTVCGDQIGYPEVGTTWAIVDIQPIQPASTVVAYRLQVRK